MDYERIIQSLTEKIERMESTSRMEQELAFNNGFSKGLRIELHFAIPFTEDGAIIPSPTKEEIEEIKDKIRKEIVPRRINPAHMF